MVRRWLIAGGTILSLVATSAAAAQQAPVPPQTAVTKPADAAKPATKLAPKKSTRKKAPEKVETPEPVEQAPPPPPPTPEESPAVAPQVSFQNGELSIRSDNATLSSILNAVKSQTGASVEAPGTTSSDRIATQLGPGDPRDVLTTLLNNSKYDFILLGAPGNPTSVQKIILTARAAGANAGGSGANAGRPAQRANFQVPAEVQQENSDQELPDAEIPDDASQPEPPQPEQPEQPEQQQQPPPTDQTQPGAPNQQKTPEQLLQELQRMQQQQQQQQEQQRQQNLNPQ